MFNIEHVIINQKNHMFYKLNNYFHCNNNNFITKNEFELSQKVNEICKLQFSSR